MVNGLTEGSLNPEMPRPAGRLTRRGWQSIGERAVAVRTTMGDGEVVFHWLEADGIERRQRAGLLCKEKP